MLKALAIKELREALAIVAIGTLLMLWLLSVIMNRWFTPWSSNEVDQGLVPFMSPAIFTTCLMFIGGAFAIAMGLQQTVRENSSKSFYFLLHRPLARNSVFFTKILVGLALLLILTAVPTLVYACWAATPGNHASPFFWGMTANAWKICLALPAVYLGAMLSGIRPARWFGSRLFPLAGACVLAFLIGMTLSFWLGVGMFLALDAVLIVLILKSAEQRDY